VLELGTALGYTALWLAQGAPQAVIDTIERDGEHVRLPREQVEAQGLAGHIVVHEGDFAEVMKQLDPGYDVAFFDGFTPSRPLLRELRRLLRARGVLISANLTHAGSDAYLAALQDKKSWLTAFIDEERETALSISCSVSAEVSDAGSIRPVAAVHRGPAHLRGDVRHDVFPHHNDTARRDPH
jgi:predicted O-methyltransferase YrrM